MREIDYLNALACLLLLFYAFPVAVAMRKQGLWLNKLMMVALVLALGLQAIGPWRTEIPYAEWPQALANWVLLVWVTIWRRTAWAFVRCKFGPPTAPSQNLGRRRSDIERLEHSSLTHVTGGLKR